ncbi:intracellular hyaluronan-binding protein 4 isoform 2-T2 [Discoglossus pictus]
MRLEMKLLSSSPVPEAMQDSFGCAVENRFFQLLDDESDPFELLQQASEEKNKRKKKDAAAKKNANQKGVKKESQKDRKAFVTEAPVVQQTGQKRAPTFQQHENVASETRDRGNRPAFREFRPNIIEKPLEFSIEKPFGDIDKDKQVRNWLAGRGSSRGRGRGGFVRNGDYENQRGKREFERQSGSDKAKVRAEDKRGGGGPHNWGSIKDAVSEMDQVPVEENKDINETPDAAEEEPKMDEELIELAQEMTLDEWKSLQDQSRPKPDFNLRKPESTVPSKAVVIHKSKFKHLKEDEDYQYAFRKPVNDITCQLDINFGSLARPGRGARGGGRGRIRREETFTHEVVNVLSSAPNPDDPEDFPALI